MSRADVVRSVACTCRALPSRACYGRGPRERKTHHSARVEIAKLCAGRIQFDRIAQAVARRDDAELATIASEQYTIAGHAKLSSWARDWAADIRRTKEVITGHVMGSSIALMRGRASAPIKLLVLVRPTDERIATPEGELVRIDLPLNCLVEQPESDEGVAEQLQRLARERP